MEVVMDNRKLQSNSQGFGLLLGSLDHLESIKKEQKAKLNIETQAVWLFSFTNVCRDMEILLVLSVPLI